MLHDYALIIYATIFDFYVGLGMCLHQIDNFLLALVILNTATIISITGMACLELFGKQILHYLKLLIILIVKKWKFISTIASFFHNIFKTAIFFKNFLKAKFRLFSFGRFILHIRIKGRRKQHQRKKKTMELVHKDGAYAIFFAALFAVIPGTPWILIAGWLGLKVRYGFIALLAGTISKVSLITLFTYGVKFIF